MSNARTSQPAVDETSRPVPDRDLKADVRTSTPVRFEDLSVAARLSVEAGLASAARGEVAPWGRDFTSFVTDDNDD